jgi:1,4-alpha-glucan branching enzyme
VDESWEGFRWISHDDSRQNVVSFRRIDEKAGKSCGRQFFAGSKDHYRIGVPERALTESF